MFYEDSEFSQTVKIRLDQQVQESFENHMIFSGHVTIENEVLGYSAFRHNLRQSQARSNITNPAIRSDGYSRNRN